MNALLKSAITLPLIVAIAAGSVLPCKDPDHPSHGLCPHGNTRVGTTSDHVIDDVIGHRQLPLHKRSVELLSELPETTRESLLRAVRDIRPTGDDKQSRKTIVNLLRCSVIAIEATMREIAGTADIETSFEQLIQRLTECVAEQISQGH